MAQELDTVAQVQQSEAVTPEPVTQPDEGQLQAKPAQNEGIQKRFDEMTREKHDALRKADALQAQLEAQAAQTQQLMAALISRQTSEPAPDPMADVSPEDRRRLEAILSAKMAPLEQRLARMTQDFQSVAVDRQFDRVVAGEDPRVVDRARQLLAGWQRQGHTGWRPEDALVYARGELLSQEAAAANQARDAQGRYSATAASVTSSQSAPPSSAPRAAQGLPADLDRRPVEEQLALLEKHLDGKPF